MFIKITGFLVAALLIAIAVFVLAPTHPLQLMIASPGGLAAAVVATFFSLGGMWYFLSGLDTFQPRMRHAYYILCTGIIFFGAAQIQAPLLTLFDATNSWWVSSGVVLLPYTGASLLLYAGIHRIASLVGVTTIAMKWWLAGILSITGAVAITFVPHLRFVPPGAELSFDAFTALLVGGSVFWFSSAIIAYRVMQALGRSYHTAMHRLSWFYIGVGVAGIAELFYTILFPEYTWYTQLSINAIPLVTASFILLLAGMHFQAISRTRFSKDATFADIVESAAQLVSDPKAIEQQISTIKAISTVLSKNEEPSPAQRRLLVTIYLEIEDRLTSDSVVRQFKTDELRSLLPPSFIALIEETRSAPQNTWRD